MKKKLSAGLGATALAAGVLVMTGATVETATAAATCPNNNWSNITQTLAYDNFRVDGVNIRTGDGTSCTSIGQGQRTHDTVLHCYSFNGTYRWTHLFDTNTGKNGWVRNDNLRAVSGNAC